MGSEKDCFQHIMIQIIIPLTDGFQSKMGHAPILALKKQDRPKFKASPTKMTNIQIISNPTNEHSNHNAQKTSY
jgi:hypothetical protein